MMIYRLHPRLQEYLFMKSLVQDGFWELDSMQYGDLKSEIKTESPRFQVMGDSMV